MITANTLYEAVEPKATWKHLFKALRNELSESSTSREVTILLPLWLTRNVI